MGEAKRYLGLELSGAKNQKTSLAVLEFFPRERKIFLLDIFDKIALEENQSGDEALLALIEEMKPGTVKMGVNIPLELPPCITCTRKSCPLPANCTVPAVKWMRQEASRESSSRTHSTRHKEFTPYTQRPIELWIRHKVMTELPESHQFEVDETLGGNRAPLTARMNFLKKQLSGFPIVEVWPKLSMAVLSSYMDLDPKITSTYRNLEYGAYSREEILLCLSKKLELFIYERDMRKLSLHLNTFDAFTCALTAWLSDENQCVKSPKGFPISSGWIQYPKFNDNAV